MCGINGMFSSHKMSDVRLRLQRMNSAIYHRGPDGTGIAIFEDGKVALGHQRLAIIDTYERSNQPMTSNDGRWTLVFNGEIYNFKELREKLEYNFKTESDTEVLLAGISCYGVENFVPKTNGMFAFAAYDNENNQLYLVRDRLGIKPVYFSIVDEKLIFSSEIKGILSSGFVFASMNEAALDDYLGYRYVREPYTFFENIYQLESGHILKVDGQMNVNKEKYWDIPDYFNVEEEYDEEAIIADLKREIEKSVSYRMIADVPLGTYLSGGVDSSLLSAMTAKNSAGGVNTYTIGFPELNEFNCAQLVAERYNTIHHEIYLNKKAYINSMAEIIGYKDAPLGVPNEIPLAIMSRELKKKITVVLSGEGADELLGGYGKIFRSPFDYENHTEEIAGEFYDYFASLYEYTPRYIRDKYLKTEKPYRELFDNQLRERFSKKSNEYNVFYFFHKYHVKGLLQRVDCTTMLTSVEARVPFLDHNLVEHSYKNVPYSMMLRWKGDTAREEAKSGFASDYSESMDVPKYILKKVSEDYLPTEVIYRKKMGFPVPLAEWNMELEKMARELLKKSTWFKCDCIDAFLEDIRSERIGYQLLWMFINLQIFYDMYFEKEWRY